MLVAEPNYENSHLSTSAPSIFVGATPATSIFTTPGLHDSKYEVFSQL
jgi:hypothetical protein